MAPGTFIRSLFCVNSGGRPVSGLGCDAFTRNGPLLATAWAHHPYTKYNSPTQVDPNPDAFTITLTKADGSTVTSLPAGKYTLEIKDMSAIHNFRLSGPGKVAVTAAHRFAGDQLTEPSGW